MPDSNRTVGRPLPAQMTCRCCASTSIIMPGAAYRRAPRRAPMKLIQRPGSKEERNNTADNEHGRASASFYSSRAPNMVELVAYCEVQEISRATSSWAATGHVDAAPPGLLHELNDVKSESGAHAA